MLTNESPLFLRPECLAPAYTLISSGDIKLLSLDVFDTLLFRRCNKPTDVFFYQHGLLRAQQLISESIAPSEWEKLRILAEQEARKRVKNPCREVILEEIYAYLADISVVRTEKIQDVIATELEAETQLIEVDPYIADLILYAADHNIPYICISDNYLNEQQLSSLINAAYKKRSSLLPAPKTVFVSSEFRESKAHNLFPLVLRQLPLKGRDIVHLGDNYKADSRAKRCNMHFFHYPTSYLWQREIEQMESELSAHLGTAQPEPGSCLMHLRRKVASVYANNDSINNYSAYGAFVYGPLFYGYGQWCLNKARELNIRKIFCFTREAHFLVPLLKNMAPDNTEFEIKPLALSRHFMQRICIKTINVSSLLGLFASQTKITGADFFDVLGIAYEPNPYFKPDTIINRNQLKMFLKWVLIQDHLLQAISILLAQQQASFISYLQSIGFFDAATVAICDLGWNGTTQRYLSEFLKHEEKTVHMTGLYLATTTNALKVLSPHDAVYSYLIQYDQPEPLAKALFRSPEVLENITMPAYGSLKNIEGIMPIFSSSLLTATQQQQAQDIQRGILTFVTQIVRYYPNSLWEPQDFNNSKEKQLNQLILIRSVISPTLFEIQLFAHWQHEFGLGLKRVSPIIPDSQWITEQFAHKPISFLCDGHDMHSIYWLGAALTLIGGANLRDLFRLSQLGVVSRRLLDEVYINYDSQLKVRHNELKARWKGNSDTYDSQPFLLHSLRNFKELLLTVSQIAQVQNIIAIGIESKLFLQELYNYVTSIGEKIVAVDPMLKQELLEELSFDSQFFEPFCGTSAEFFESISLNKLKGTTLFLLDGDHNYATVKLELEAIHNLYLTQSSTQPLVFIHDTGWPWGHRDLYYEQGKVSLVDRQKQSVLHHGVHINNSTAFPGSNFHLVDASLAVEEGGEKNGVMAAVESFLGQYPDYVSWHIPAIFGLNIILPATLPQIKTIESLIPSWASSFLSRLEENRIEMYLHLIKMNTLVYQYSALEQQFSSLQKKHLSEIEFFRKKLNTETHDKRAKLLKKVKKAGKKVSTWWRLQAHKVVTLQKK
ncbi:hypothetical protein [Legionella pneumophila]|uniref:hypothetical protein n=1 Tax=Legionella pneumophila TaxID=446 RepID=UPI00077838F0|nr:hypothetical protein [Legionella pneumophila]HAT8606384.1 hypothetical protein [Legionella pneumophila]